MNVSKSEVLSILTSDAIVLVRQAVRRWAVEQGFSLVEQTKMITAASEVVRRIAFSFVSWR